MTAEQALLLDLLYGELDEDSAASSTQTIEADDELSADFAAFGSVRALMSELPAEEPPASISAQLVHAAAAAVPTSSKKSAEPLAAGGGVFSWLKNLFMPLAMHPAMAAAASLVLVVGVAGAIYMSGNWKVSEPTADSKASSSVSSDSPRADDRLAMPEGRAKEDKKTDDGERGAAGPPEETAVAGNESANNEPTATTADQANQPGRKSLDMNAQTKAPPPPPRIARLRKGKKKFKLSGKSTAEITPSDDADEDTAKKKPVVVTKKPANKRWTRNTGKTQKSPEPDTTKPNKKRSPKDEKSALRLHKKAQLAAKRGQCGAVTKLGNRIRQVSGYYWSNNYRRDPKVRCDTTRLDNAFKAGEKSPVKAPAKK